MEKALESEVWVLAPILTYDSTMTHNKLFKLSDFWVQINISVIQTSEGFGKNQMKILLRLQNNIEKYDTR